MNKDLSKDKNFNELVKKIEESEFVDAYVLFGSYAKNKQKPNSDIDICIFRKEGSRPADFEEVFSVADEKYDILFFDNLTDIIKFRVLTEGKILKVKDKIKFTRMKKKFLHSYRDNYPFYKRNMKRMMANV